MFDFDAFWKNLSTYEQGQPLEQAFAGALSFYGLFITRNCTEAGADFLVDNLIFELKNWSGQYWISPPLVQKNILSRFLRSDPDHKKQWIVVMTGAYALSLASRLLLASYNIRIINVGEQVRTAFNEATCRNKLVPILSHILPNNSNSELNIVDSVNSDLRSVVEAALCGVSDEPECLVDYASEYLHEFHECFLYNS